MKWTIHPLSDFKRLSKDWDAANAYHNVPFLRADFMEPLLAQYATGRELVVIGRGDDGALAAGIVVQARPLIWQTFQPSQLPLGAWLMPPDRDLNVLLSGLLEALPGFALIIGITQQDPSILPRPSNSSCVYTLNYVDTAWVDVNGSFDEYWNSRGKNLRQNMRKQRSRLEGDGLRTGLETLTSPGDVVDAIRDYGALESSGWKAEGGTAINLENAQGRFYSEMMQALCADGSARIYRYRFGHNVVAVDLCVVGGGALVILKTTYDEGFKAYSPAFLMRQEAFAQIFGEKAIERIEFYGKVMEWHTRWTTNCRMLYHINYYRWPWLRKLHRLIG